MSNLLQLEPIQKFIGAVGKGVEKYFGRDEGCIISLRPDGVFYAQGLYEWLQRKKRNVVLVSMDDDGGDIQEEKVKGKKVLIVDNDIVTGKGYKRSMEALRLRRKRLNIRDIKFAVFSDRVGLADFFVGKYSPEAIWHLEEMDAVDLKIILYLCKNGRASFAEIGEKINLSSVAVKHRVDKLLKEKILRVEGGLRIDQFYTMSAQVYLEADGKTIVQLVEQLKELSEVYHIVKMSGTYNLAIGILAHNLENIEDFVEKKIRIVPGVKNLEVSIGELPFMPKTFCP